MSKKTLLEVEYSHCDSCNDVVEKTKQKYPELFNGLQYTNELLWKSFDNEVDLLNKEKEKVMCISYYNQYENPVYICMECLKSFLLSTDTELIQKYEQYTDHY